MKFSSLCLDDILEDSPQTRFMVKMFEDDAEKVHSFATSMQSALERLVCAQSESMNALQHLSSLFQNYQQLNFQLERQENDFVAAMEKFGATISELASWLELMLQQLQNCVLHPVKKLVNELNLIEQQKALYHGVANDLDSLQIRMSRMNRRDSPKKVDDLGADYSLTRKKFHKAGLGYFVHLNGLQYQRRIAFVEPILSLLYAFRTLFHVGDQTLSQQPDLNQFFGEIQNQIQNYYSEQQKESAAAKQHIQTMAEIERIRPDLYSLEFSTEPVGAVKSSNELKHKHGYVFLKSKSALMTHWDRYYVFIQNECLMCQGRDELASRVFLELTSEISASEYNSGDRLNCFAITCSTTNKEFVFQALSDAERCDWIAAINSVTHPAEVPSRLEAVAADTLKGKNGKMTEQEIQNAVLPDDVKFDVPPCEVGACHEPPTPSCEECVTKKLPLFQAKYLGSVPVKGCETQDAALAAIKAVLAARAQQKSQTAKDVAIALVADPSRLCLFAAGRERQLLLCCPSHRLKHTQPDQNNERLLALVVRSPENAERAAPPSFFHVLESTGTETAEQICKAVQALMKSTPGFQVPSNAGRSSEKAGLEGAG